MVSVYRASRIGESTQSSGKNEPGNGLLTRTYNVNGELVRLVDKADQKNNRYFVNDAQGRALTVVNGKFDGKSGRLIESGQLQSRECPGQDCSRTLKSTVAT